MKFDTSWKVALTKCGCISTIKWSIKNQKSIFVLYSIFIHIRLKVFVMIVFNILAKNNLESDQQTIHGFDDSQKTHILDTWEFLKVWLTYYCGSYTKVVHKIIKFRPFIFQTHCLLSQTLSNSAKLSARLSAELSDRHFDRTSEKLSERLSARLTGRHLEIHSRKIGLSAKLIISNIQKQIPLVYSFIPST